MSFEKVSLVSHARDLSLPFSYVLVFCLVGKDFVYICIQSVMGWLSLDDLVCKEVYATILLMWVINVYEHGLFDVHISTALLTKF